MRRIDLAGAWKLVRASTGESVPATVPGDTHSALLAARRIPDPYQGSNELDVQWVAKEDWTFERSFQVPAGFLSEASIVLRCERLDTIADIEINGRRAGHADNMFERWCFEVKPLLKPGRNTIRVRFRSAEKAALSESRRLPYPIPHTMNPVQSMHRNLVRKAQCHSGWDWGPCLMVAGIYGEISLQATSQARIEYVYTEQRHSRGRCRLRVFVECDVVRPGEYPLTVDLDGQRGSHTFSLAKGRSRVSIDVTVPRPRLWWPNGLGEQKLYGLTVEIGGDQVRKRIGLRTLELRSKEDAAGLSMGFRVNGVDFFCKGANWIPCDALPSRQTREHLTRLLDGAFDAHMNMLRVWGGGQYESDDFYELCDERGLLVWQDMMFSCALYPSDRAFLDRVEREVRHQARRLRDHPCLALWCGNNEDLGALTWFPESRANRDRYVVDYDRLNEGVIGRTLDECDPTHPFWPSSPSGGRGDYSDNWHSDNRGDMHFWSVWHEGKPFEAYRSVRPRFCSEFGYQSFPSLATVKGYASEADLNVTSPILEHHQRNPGGNSRITEMFTRLFRFPEGFANFVYLSQVQQALAIKTAVEYWRSLRPHCMGALYWQLNDLWPVCSWSSLEYEGRWKLLHYAARRFFAPTLILCYRTKGGLEVWGVNDRREPLKAKARVSFMTFSGRELRGDSIPVAIPAGRAALLRRYRAESLPAGDQAFVRLALREGNRTSTNELFLTEPKRCELPKAQVTTEVSADDEGLAVGVSTDAPAFYVTLEAEGIEGEFEDNGFSLLPGEHPWLRFHPRQPTTAAGLRRALSVRHLRDTYR